MSFVSVMIMPISEISWLLTSLRIRSTHASWWSRVGVLCFDISPLINDETLSTYKRLEQSKEQFKMDNEESNLRLK